MLDMLPLLIIIAEHIAIKIITIICGIAFLVRLIDPHVENGLDNFMNYFPQVLVTLLL